MLLFLLILTIAGVIKILFVVFCSLYENFLELLIVNRIRILKPVKQLWRPFNINLFEVDPLEVVIYFLDVAVVHDILDDEGVDTAVVPEVVEATGGAKCHATVFEISRRLFSEQD